MEGQELRDWFFGVADKFPGVFRLVDLDEAWDLSEQAVCPQEDFLRSALSRLSYPQIHACQRCELHCNAKAAGATISDGDWCYDYLGNALPLGQEASPIRLPDPTSRIMVIAEGPGNFEQRTGQPFVGNVTLPNSFCGSECVNYESCYPVGCSTPRQECSFVSLEEMLTTSARRAARTSPLSHPQLTGKVAQAKMAIFKERLDLAFSEKDGKEWSIYTAGVILDRMLFAAGLRRPSMWTWFFQQGGLNTYNAGERIHLTNIVVHRSVGPDGKDAPPEKEHSQACRFWLDLRMYIYQPEVLVVFGAPAIQALLKLQRVKVADMRGAIRRGPNDIPTICDYHPIYVARSSDARSNDPNDIAKAKARGQSIEDGIVATLKLAVQVANGEVELPWKNQCQIASISLPEPLLDRFSREELDPDD